jgi:acetoin utilization protein AcuB
MEVRDIATTNLKMATPQFAVRNLRDLLNNSDFRHVPIVDDERGVVGVVSQHDLSASAAMARHFGGGREGYEAFLKQPVKEFLKTRFADRDGLVTVTPGTSVEEAAELMVTHKLTAIPVVEEDGEIFGIVSYTDILRSSFDIDDEPADDESAE